LEELCSLIFTLLTQRIDNNSASTENITGLGTQRQKELTEKAISFLEEALLLEKKGESLDLIAHFFRESLNALGEITGEVSSADILEIMFSRFCLGK
jgi:tRNA modification GTPase